MAEIDEESFNALDLGDASPCLPPPASGDQVVGLPPASGDGDQAVSEEGQEDHAQPRQDHAQPRQDHAQPRQDNAQPRQDNAQPRQDNAQPRQDNAQPRQDHAQPRQDNAQPRQDNAQPRQTAQTGNEHVGSSSVIKTQEDRWVSDLDQFKLMRFFVLRPGTLTQAIGDIESLVDEKEDGRVHGIWLLAEVDHWNNEKERVVLVTDRTLLICKYDFVMLTCEKILRIPLNFVDRISHGAFSFPKHTFLLREGEGVRIFWDRLREPSFISRWNPFATDFPFMTFTCHPVSETNDELSALCDIQDFRKRLKEAAEKAHLVKPIPGKANGVLVLNQPIPIEVYVGLLSFIGNQNKLGYCLARGSIGF